MKLCDKWRFCIDENGIGIQDQWHEKGLPTYNEVVIPHTFNVDKETENYRGMAWYEYHFTPEESWSNKRIRVQFNGVYRDADIWMNGILIGKHYNSGYTQFTINCEDTIKYHQENILTVCVQNHYSELAIPFTNNFDWADDGGIYREVKFIITGQAAIDYIKLNPKPVINKEMNERQNSSSAVLSGDIFLCGPTNLLSGDLDYSFEIFKGTDTTETPVYSSKIHKIPHDSKIFIDSIYFDNVRLWHFDDPQLYTMYIKLWQNNDISDTLTINFGFREFEIRNSFFILNGEQVRLTGTEWMPGANPKIGTAESIDYMSKVLTQLKETNCVFTRFHWQQDEEVFNWCDRNGMLVQEEIPLWGAPKVPGDQQMMISKFQADEMISSHYNHPSIIAWGMGNELDGQNSQTTEYMISLKEYIKSLDSNRIVSYVTNSFFEGASTDATIVGDMIMFNDYLGTWHGQKNLPEELDKIIKANPNKPLIVSEFGLCEPTFLGGDLERIKIFKEKMDTYRKYSQIAGTINFCLNDYRTQMGEDGEGTLRKRIHGSTDLIGNEKPSYFVLQEYCAPIKIVKSVVVDNGFLFTLKVSNDLPSYTVQNYIFGIYNDREEQLFSANIQNLRPNEQYDIFVNIHDLSGYCIKILRPNGFLVRRYIMSNNCLC